LILTLPYVNVVRKVYAPFYRVREKMRRGPRQFDQFVYTRGEVVSLLRESGLRVVACRRTHCITVLMRIPGIQSLHHMIFPLRRIAASTGGASKPPVAAASRSRLKPLIKAAVEGFLNLLIANRLTVVAEKTG
jgi:hypothetical protein